MAAHRILHVLGTADLAGSAICQMVERLALALDAKQYEIEACFLQDGVFVDQFNAYGIRSTCVNWTGKPKDLIGAVKFAKILRLSSFDLIHLHTGGRFLTKICRIATSAVIVLHVHARASEDTGLVSSIIRLPERDFTIANSHVIASACGDPNAVVIYPGVDVAEYRAPAAKQNMILGTACRLQPVKGVRTLIEAIAILAKDHPAIRLEIAGDGRLRADLEEHAARLKLSGSVSFLGWRKDIASLMHSWSIFIQPSLDEGFGVAALEAMASGLPVVASDVGGLRELVQDGRTGFLVPAGAPAAFAAKIRLLLDDPGLRARMGAAGRQRAQDGFTITTMVRKIAELYGSLLKPV